MIRKSRAEIAALKGEKLPQPAAQPAPAAPAAPDTGEQLRATVEQLASAAQILAASAQSASKKKQMEAIIHRDKHGRMARVTINIT